MRHNNKDIVLTNLLPKIRKKVEKPKELVKMKTIYIGDNMRTQFIVPEGKDEQEVRDRYLRSRKYK